MWKLFLLCQYVCLQRVNSIQRVLQMQKYPQTHFLNLFIHHDTGKAYFLTICCPVSVNSHLVKY